MASGRRVKQKRCREASETNYYLTDLPMPGLPPKFDEYRIQPRKTKNITSLLKTFTKNVLFNSDPIILLIA